MAQVRATAANRIMAAALACIAWFALGLQLYLMLVTAPEGGLAALLRLVNYFSFFTILTNLLVALTLTFAVTAPSSRPGRFSSSAATQTGIAVYIAAVGAIYSLLLRHLWSPQGAQKLADALLHDVMPIAYVLYWWMFVPKAMLRWKHALQWLCYPVAYMAYILARGAATGWYPYPFVDAAIIGFPRALRNGAIVLLIFFLLGLAAVAIGRSTRLFLRKNAD